MPETHRSVSRDIEAKAKGGKNKNKDKKRALSKYKWDCQRTQFKQHIESRQNLQQELWKRSGKPSLHYHGNSVDAVPEWARLVSCSTCCHHHSHHSLLPFTTSGFLFLPIVVASCLIKQIMVSLDCASMVVSISISLSLSFSQTM